VSGTRLSEIQEALPPLREHRLEGARCLNTLCPVSEDIRRQLEGGIETLEAAHRRYVLLEKALQREQWQHEVLTRLEPLREQIREEPDVVEALTRLRQRCRAEGWPDMEPALVLARKMEKLRSRLDALMRERLGGPTTRESFAEKLARLHQVLAQTIAPPVSSEERVLLQGLFEADLGKPIQPLLRMLVGMIVILVVGGLLSGLLAMGSLLGGILLEGGTFLAGGLVIIVGTVLVILVGCMLMTGCLLLMPLLGALGYLLQSRRSGRFWLTGERLVWLPTGKDPIHIPLHAIAPDGARLRSARSVGVRLVDGRSFHLDYIQGAERLVSLLEQHVTTPGAAPSSRT
jgi:hypothetical protein